MEIDGTEH